MLSCATESCSIQCFFARSNDDLILDENASNFLLLTGLPGRRFLLLSIVIVSPFGSFFLPLGFLFGDLLLRVQSALHQLVVKETVVVHFIKVYSNYNVRSFFAKSLNRVYYSLTGLGLGLWG